MKKLWKRVSAALMAAATMAGAVLTGGSAVTANAVENDKIAEYPTIGYNDMIYTLDDYKLAVKRRFLTNEEVKEALNAADNYVPYVDNSKLKYFPKIDSQGSIGSCVSWSVVYYQFTHEVNKALDRAATPETTMQPMFIYNMYIGCNKGRHLEGLVNSTGCAPISLAPEFYNDKTWNTGYDIWREAANYRIYDFIDFAGLGDPGREVASETDPDLDAIKAALRNGDVLSYAGPIGDHQWDTIKAAPGVDDELVGQGIVTKSVGSCIFNHMLTVVGYNDNIWMDLNKNGKVDKGEKGALKIANSWGDKWGNNAVAPEKKDGFYWIAYDALNARSCVEGVVSEPNRGKSASGFGRMLVSKDYGTSGIFLKYTLNNDNRADSYVEITAKRKTDGMLYIRKVNPYYFANYETVNCQRLNYEGKTGFCDGEMLYDLNNVVLGLDSNTFNDYDWSFRFVDIGTDTTDTTVKEAYVVDENTDKTYAVNVAFPFTLNKSEKTAVLKDFYHFAKLYVPAANTLTVNSELKFTFKTANETFGSTPIKYTMTVKKDGKQVFSKVHKASSVDKKNGSSVIKGTYKPTATGTYTITITGTDASGAKTSRSADFRVYNKLLAIRSIDLDTGKYINTYQSVKITPQVTGGTAPYTYSYYYIKGGKTYKIAENIKNSSKTKTFGSNAGTYKIMVKVKDAAGTTVQSTTTVLVTPPAITKVEYSDTNGYVNRDIYISAAANYLPDCVKPDEFIYTAEKDGKVETLSHLTGRQTEKVVWTPKERGEYTITVSVKYKDKLLAERKEKYVVGPTEQVGQRTINVYVISYIFNTNGGANYKIHYWGGKSGIGEANCISLSQVKTKDVGFWSTPQQFRTFVAYIPDDATGYKFHIGDRWFPDGIEVGDGSTATSNTVYAFNYDVDRAVYTME